MMSAADIVLATLERLYRERLRARMPVALHEPRFTGNEWAYVKECLDSGWVSSVSPFVDRFERQIAVRSGAAHAMAVVNGTSALHLALMTLGVRAGDLVVCPAISFVATANAIAHCGASPVFVDIDPSCAAIDPELVAAFLEEECEGEGSTLRHRPSGRRVAALVAVHIFGHPVDLDALRTTANRYGLPLVEDATESIGSLYKDRPCGARGDIGVLSFNGNKIITTGGGGALVTNDEALARRARHLGTTARVTHAVEFDHDAVGYNYRLPALNAALGVAQFEQLDGWLVRKRRLAGIYMETLGGLGVGRVVREPDYGVSNYWLNALVLDDQEQRNPILERLNAGGFQARALWRPLPDLPMYRDAPQARSGVGRARDLATRLINLPSSPHLVPDAELASCPPPGPASAITEA